ncbi:MAG: VOC family protein [Gemmatimonadaceae bacterium]
MSQSLLPGTVIFSHDKERLARFYQGVTGWAVTHVDGHITVLRSATCELVIHAIPPEYAPPPSDGQASDAPPAPREDAYLKPFFPVDSILEARARAHALGGALRPEGSEWEGRGFRACEGVDADGNVIQLREAAPPAL